MAVERIYSPRIASLARQSTRSNRVISSNRNVDFNLSVVGVSALFPVNLKVSLIGSRSAFEVPDCLPHNEDYSPNCTARGGENGVFCPRNLTADETGWDVCQGIDFGTNNHRIGAIHVTFVIGVGCEHGIATFVRNLGQNVFRIKLLPGPADISFSAQFLWIAGSNLNTDDFESRFRDDLGLHLSSCPGDWRRQQNQKSLIETQSLLLKIIFSGSITEFDS